MGGGADRISGLSDDLLAYIVSLLPTREAVRTAALSRRWRPIWLGAHSLILDSMSYGDRSEDNWAYLGCEDDGTNNLLFSNACAFLGAAGRCSPITNLSLTVHGRDKEYFQEVMCSSVTVRGSPKDGCDLMASLLAAPALRYLEEVRVRFKIVRSPERCQREKKISGWVYKLDPSVLPEHTLRVLDLAHCRLESPTDGAAAVSFPRLSSVRLYRCSSSTEDLEGWIRAAPSLRSVHIQDHNFYRGSGNGPRTLASDRFALHSASLTALTLLYDTRHSTREHFELDVPRLRVFKYNGAFEAFSMKREHLVTLPALERLELRGLSDPGRRNEAALAIANLLQCCPVIQDLRIRIPTDPYKSHYAYTRNTYQARLSDFEVYMDLFRRRFSKEMVPLMLDRDDDATGSSQVAGLPGLTGCRFPCLENHLKSVTLQFVLKELNSFEVCLTKFFADGL